MTHNVIHVANSILSISFAERKIAISHMKLQKLTYLLAGWYRAKYGEDLIDSKFEAWKYGPVESNLYHTFKKYGSDIITNYGKKHTEEKPFMAKLSDEKLSEAINFVLNCYGDLTALELSTLTHEKGSPWEIARGKGQKEIDFGEVAKHLNEKYSEN